MKNGSAPKKSKPKPPLGFYYLTLGVIILLLITLSLFLDRLFSVREDSLPPPPEEDPLASPIPPEVPPPVPPFAPPRPAPPPQVSPPPSPPPQGSRETPPPGPVKGRLIFVIDDVGNSLEDLEAFLAVPLPLVFAVMPHCPWTGESVRRIREAGKMAILHQPMEAVGSSDPGGGAIYAGMGREEVFAVLDSNLEQTGPLPGINNHMGSRVTTDRETMGYVLEYLGERGMFFLDSVTNTGGAAETLSREMGLSYAKRNSPFLDNDPSREAVEAALDAGLKAAGRLGTVIMIGHLRTGSLAGLLKEGAPRFREEGYAVENLESFFKEAGHAGAGS